ncbi:uncharacterized protein LOC133198240 [Saccostrea echinata]|uniref:uncharacterized protein LOC133198240 n=1 Tax=Saccostrea echinata TaxID=191078 RepID=UPI002A801677|nr:uncharacterized protein LOC133198240 [Saccostrea echinata]
MFERSTISTFLVVLNVVSAIQIEFENGNLIFDWTHTSTSNHSYDVIITRDGEASKRVVNSKIFVVHDLLNFSSVSISIREDNNGVFKFYNRTFKVYVFSTTTNKDKSVSWKMPYFPESGHLSIFHKYLSTELIFRISDPNVYYMNQYKYKYLSNPVNSVFVNFTIFNLTLYDAGFYYDRIHLSDFIDSGAFLLVYGKPTKPTIFGQRKVKMGVFTNLTCSSKSTSTPFYYKQFPPMRYRWFANNTEISEFIGNVYTFKVTNIHRNVPFTCQSTEIESSEISETFSFEVVGNEKVQMATEPRTAILTTTKTFFGNEKLPKTTGSATAILTTKKFSGKENLPKTREPTTVVLTTTETFSDEKHLCFDSRDKINTEMMIALPLCSIIIILILWIVVPKLKGSKICKKSFHGQSLGSQYLTPIVDYDTLPVIYNKNRADQYHEINDVTVLNNTDEYGYIEF